MAAKRLLSLIDIRAYADPAQRTQFDIALSPALTLIGELLARVRCGDLDPVHSLRHRVPEEEYGGPRRPLDQLRVAPRQGDPPISWRADRHHRVLR